MIRSHVLVTCCKTASLGLNYTINWDNTCLVLCSVLADNKRSTNAIVHSMLPLGQNIFAILVWIMWLVRSPNEWKYAFINQLDIFQKFLMIKGGKRHSTPWSRKRSVSLNFSLKCTRQNVIKAWCVMKHLCIQTTDFIQESKNRSNDQKEKEILTCQLSFGQFFIATITMTAFLEL